MNATANLAFHALRPAFRGAEVLDRMHAEIERKFGSERNEQFAVNNRIKARTARRVLMLDFAKGKDGFPRLMSYIQSLDAPLPRFGLFSTTEAIAWLRKVEAGEIVRRNKEHRSFRPDILRGARERLVLARYFALAGQYWWAREIAA